MLLVMGPDGMAFLWVLLAVWPPAFPIPALSLSVPEHITGLSGSCIVLPCSFTPSSSNRQVRVRVRFHSKFLTSRNTAFSSEPGTQVHSDYKGRMVLAGTPNLGDCSVHVDKLRMGDGKRYEIEVREMGVTEWRRSQPIQLKVIDKPTNPEISNPGSITMGQQVTLKCTASHVCHTHPPQLQWHFERGSPANQSQKLHGKGQGQEMITSVSFNASQLPPPRLRCEASFPGKRTVSAVRELHVRFPPRDVKVLVQTEVVQEGSSALLSCSYKADPPASYYRWWYSQGGHTVTLPEHQQMVRINNVTRDMVFYCSATNSLGKAESPPKADVVQYKPLISADSSCHWDVDTVSCCCLLKGNPRPAVTWSVNGSAPSQSYNASTAAQNGELSACLSGEMLQPLNVVCYAYNAWGNNSAMLLQGGQHGDTDTLLWKIVPAASILLSLSFLSLLLLMLRSRRKASRRPVPNYRPPLYPGAVSLYQDHTPLYINCTEVTHIYTNGSYQLVYQNCTPVFVRSQQWRGQRERHMAWRDRMQVEKAAARSDAETAVYLEVM